MVAILTADLVDSSLYEEDLLEEVLNTLKEEFDELRRSWSSETLDFRIYRGDSFQGLVQKPQHALRIALQIRTAVNSIHFRKTVRNKAFSKVADFRIAIGVGTLDFERESISESNGQAFQFSGRTLDEMKNGLQRTKIKTPNPNINEEFNASFFLLDTIIEKWSTASAEVVYYLLKGMKEREIAEQLNISQSAVNQRKKASGWDAINVLVSRYEKVMAGDFANG